MRQKDYMRAKNLLEEVRKSYSDADNFTAEDLAMEANRKFVICQLSVTESIVGLLEFFENLGKTED